MAPVLLEPHPEARGVEIATADVRDNSGTWMVGGAWKDLDTTPREPGTYDIRVAVDGGPGGLSAQVPVCAGRKRVALDGRDVGSAPGPVVVPLPAGVHELVVSVVVSKYERRIACGDAMRVGPASPSVEGLGRLSFSSPYGAKGGGVAVVYIPPGHDLHAPAPLLVGLHPWNGTMWTYAAYAALLREARARDVVLLLPSGLGNSLYTGDAEDEAMRALDALGEVVPVDARRVSLWGASMGGAGATTVGFHHPDRFATVTSFFGDSKYDMTTYVHGLLHDESGAHMVNAVDVVDNARWLPVWLVHGEDDRTSPIRQSELLDQAMREHGFTVHFDRVPGMGHAGALVARFLTVLVDRASTSRVPDAPRRVTFRSVRPWDSGAYGVHFGRTSESGDAFVDVERRDDGVHVLRAEGLRGVTVDAGSLGTDADHLPELRNDTGRALDVHWVKGVP